MLEFWIFFHKKIWVNRDSQINFVNYKITFQLGLERKIEYMVKKGHYFMFFYKVLALQMKVCHFGNVM